MATDLEFYINDLGASHTNRPKILAISAPSRGSDMRTPRFGLFDVLASSERRAICVDPVLLIASELSRLLQRVCFGFLEQ